MWIRSLFKELQLDNWISIPYTVLCDNRAAIDFAKNRIERARTKHIDIAYHITHEKINDGTIKLEYVSSGDNVADIFTKPLKKQSHEKNVTRMSSY